MDNKKLFISLSATQDARTAAAQDTSDLADLMANPDYLRYSSSIINEALKEGFDVLQLPNGDIVTTGTRIITNTYVWNATANSMSKARSNGAAKSPRGRKPKAASASSQA